MNNITVLCAIEMLFLKIYFQNIRTINNHYSDVYIQLFYYENNKIH